MPNKRIATVGQCESNSWTAPAAVPLADSTERPTLRFSSIAAGKSGVFISGTAGALPYGTHAPQQLIALELGGRDLGIPPGSFGFDQPLAAVDHLGRLHLVWAEHNASDATEVRVRIASKPPSSLWAVSHDSASGWTAPTRIYEGTVLWGKGANDEIVRDHDGRLQLVIPLLSASDVTMIHIQFDGQDWSSSAVTTPRPVAYSSVIALGRKLFVGFVAAKPVDNGRDVNSVFLMQSDDGGAHWSPPVLVSESGLTPAHHLKVRTDEAGRIHMLWIESLPNGQRVLRHLVTSDAGATWSVPHDVVPTAGFNAPQVAIDRCGRVHAIYEDVEGGSAQVHLSHAMLSESGWSAATPLFKSWRAIDPSLRTLDDGRLLLVFLGQPPGGSPEAIPILLHSFLMR